MAARKKTVKASEAPARTADDARGTEGRGDAADQAPFDKI